MTAILSRSLVVATLATAGCVSHNHLGYNTALRCGAGHPIGPLCRSQVHLFVVNGLDPTQDNELLRLRDEVNQAGYAMVHVVQRADTEFVRREMHRLRRDQPPCRFVLLGYGASAGRVREIACRVSSESLPLDAVVLLDPAGGPEVVEAPVPVVVVRSHHWPAGRNLATADVIELAAAGHLSLPADPQTVATVLRLLDASAARIQLDPPGSLPHLAPSDHPQPTPRPVVPVPEVTQK
jgi:hypothetical protein